MEYFVWIEETVVSTWLRESSWALFALLIIHSISMGLAAGLNVAFDLRVLGIASKIPRSKFLAFEPIVILCLWTVLGSGLLLLLAYPAKALLNPVFYFKLMCVSVALVIGYRLSLAIREQRQLKRDGRNFAVFSLLLWILAISAGRFLAYTHSVVLASFY